MLWEITNCLQPIEKVIVSLFSEVKRYKPSVIYIPNIEAWWANMTETAILTFITMLRAIPPTDPIMLLATAEADLQDLDRHLLQDLFGYSKKNRAVIGRPSRVILIHLAASMVTDTDTFTRKPVLNTSRTSL